jgi:DNA repair exonuclease SbcCD nuclease subunit
MTRTPKAKAVLIADVHFSVPTLELATKAMIMAMDKAVELDVPLIVAGDLLDGKAIIRAEVANRLLELIPGSTAKILIIVGNHDLISEKGEEHALHFLKDHCQIISTPTQFQDFALVPYQTDPVQMEKILSTITPYETIICHQGIQGAYLGHYAQDKSGISKTSLLDRRVLSGHYHRRQKVTFGVEYIGNPYTLTFGEASDGPKGFLVFYDNTFADFIPTNLRKHVIVELRTDTISAQISGINHDDLVWVKITGPQSELAKVNKRNLADILNLEHRNFKLDLIPETTEGETPEVEVLTEAEILDSLIDAMPETKEQKETLKATWRTICA